MRKKILAVAILELPLTAQQSTQENVDLGILNQIKRQAFNNSQVMDHLFYFSEVYGPRVTNSPNHRAAAEWIVKRLESYGLQNVHLEPWGPFGNAWQYKKFYGALVERTMLRSSAFRWHGLRRLTARLPPTLSTLLCAVRKTSRSIKASCTARSC
jgi:hypothetical protein